MSRVASLFSQRVPLRIWLPVVIGCAVAGYVVSTLWPVRPTPSQPHIPRSEGPSQAPGTAPEEPTRTAGQLLRAIGSPGDVAGHHEQTPDDVGASVPPPRATKGTPPRARAARANHTVAKARRPQRTAQQPTKALSKSSSTGLKSIPLIGPVFSMFQ
jgi:hypothetical protein